MFVLGYHWLPLATIDLVGDNRNLRFEADFEMLYSFWVVNSLRKHVFTHTQILILKLLLAHLESAYSLIWGAQEIWGKGGGETLALLW